MKKKIISFRIIGMLLILVMLIGILTGCYERVETEGFEYDEVASIVTLKGSAPTDDFLGRILDNSQVEFRFYNKRTDDWDKEYRTVEKDSSYTSGGRLYFSADIGDLEPNKVYHVRALGYYDDPYPDPIESGWGYSKMMNFEPSDQKGTTESLQIDQIDYTDNAKLQMILELLMKNPGLKERFFNRYLGIS